MVEYLKKYKELIEKPLTVEQINNIQYYCNKEWYLQLLREFGIIIVLIIMKYYEDIEDYLKCQSILDTIKNSNKNFGSTYHLTLEEYGYMS